MPFYLLNPTHQEAKDLFTRRKYTVQGSCLLYKGQLLTSHLSPDLQSGVNLYLNCHGLVQLAERQTLDQVKQSH